jgi:hypothetical protein
MLSRLLKRGSRKRKTGRPVSRSNGQRWVVGVQPPPSGHLAPHLTHLQLLQEAALVGRITTAVQVSQLMAPACHCYRARVQIHCQHEVRVLSHLLWDIARQSFNTPAPSYRVYRPDSRAFPPFLSCIEVYSICCTSNSEVLTYEYAVQLVAVGHLNLLV